MKVWHFEIPGPPITKKNHTQIVTNRKTGKPFLMQNQKYIDYETAAAYYLQPAPRDPIEGPVTVTCRYYMPTRRRVDLTNLMAATHDILVRFFILADDSRDVIASTDGSRVYYNKDFPRVEIDISPFEEPYTPFHTEKAKKGK